MAEFVILLALGIVGEDFVGFLGFFEAFGGLGIVLGDVGVELSSQLAEGAFDFVGRCGSGDAQDIVVVAFGHCDG